jgi:hypothetical protein
VTNNNWTSPVFGKTTLRQTQALWPERVAMVVVELVVFEADGGCFKKRFD